MSDHLADLARKDHPYRIIASTRAEGCIFRWADTQREADRIAEEMRQEYAGRLSAFGVYTEYLYEGAWHKGRYWWGRH